MTCRPRVWNFHNISAKTRKAEELCSADMSSCNTQHDLAIGYPVTAIVIHLSAPRTHCLHRRLLASVTVMPHGWSNQSQRETRS